MPDLLVEEERANVVELVGHLNHKRKTLQARCPPRSAWRPEGVETARQLLRAAACAAQFVPSLRAAKMVLLQRYLERP